MVYDGVFTTLLKLKIQKAWYFEGKKRGKEKRGTTGQVKFKENIIAYV